MTASDALSGLTQATVIFTVALALSFVIERVLELLKTGYDLAESRWRWHDVWNREARRIRDFAEHRLRAFNYVDPSVAANALGRFSETLLGPEAGHTGTVPLLSGDLVRVVWVRMIAKLVGMLLGIVLATLFRVDLLAVFKDPENPLRALSTLGVWLTGVGLGLGSGPVHKLITTIERQKDKRAARKAEEGA
jgi:hypothetical protein